MASKLGDGGMQAFIDNLEARDLWCRDQWSRSHWSRSHWSGGDTRRERMTRRQENDLEKSSPHKRSPHKRDRSPAESEATWRETDGHFAAKRRDAKREMRAQNNEFRARGALSANAPACLPKDNAEGGMP
jgi:hypothetical protein